MLQWFTLHGRCVPPRPGQTHLKNLRYVDRYLRSTPFFQISCLCPFYYFVIFFLFLFSFFFLSFFLFSFLSSFFLSSSFFSCFLPLFLSSVLSFVSSNLPCSFFRCSLLSPSAFPICFLTLFLRSSYAKSHTCHTLSPES